MWIVLQDSHVIDWYNVCSIDTIMIVSAYNVSMTHEILQQLAQSSFDNLDIVGS